MKYLKNILGILIILVLFCNTVVYGLNRVEQLDMELIGYRLQIERANHYIEYSQLRNLEETHPSIIQAKKIIEESQSIINQKEGYRQIANDLDIADALQNTIDNNEKLLDEVYESEENYKKLSSLLIALQIDEIIDLPVELLKSLGLYNYTYNLLKSENIELNESWKLEEEKMEIERLKQENIENQQVLENNNNNDEIFGLLNQENEKVNITDFE